MRRRGRAWAGASVGGGSSPPPHTLTTQPTLPPPTLPPPTDPCAEYRISVYGRKPVEWDTLAAWVVQNRLRSDNNVWMIQARCVAARAAVVCVRAVMRGGCRGWARGGLLQLRGARPAPPPPPKHTHAPHLPPTRTRTRTPSPCLLRTRQQVPRLYNVYKEQGIIENFEQARARRSPRFACPPPHACWPAALLPPPAHPLPLLLPLPSLRCPRHAIPPACLPARPPTHLPPRCAGVQLLDNIFTPLALCTALVTNQPTPRRPLAQLLDNIFTPLFEVTADPSSHPQLHLFLRTVGGGAWVGGRAGG